MEMVSHEQLEVLVDFLERNPMIARGLRCTSTGKAETMRKWQEISRILNSLGGVKKDGVEWSKFWRDKKNEVKRLCARMNSFSVGTGKDSSSVLITDMDERMISLVRGQSFGLGNSGSPMNPFTATEGEVFPPNFLVQNMSTIPIDSEPEVEVVDPVNKERCTIRTAEGSSNLGHGSSASQHERNAARDRSPIKREPSSHSQYRRRRVSAHSGDALLERMADIKAQRVDAEAIKARALRSMARSLEGVATAITNLSNTLQHTQNSSSRHTCKTFVSSLGCSPFGETSKRSIPKPNTLMNTNTQESRRVTLEIFYQNVRGLNTKLFFFRQNLLSLDSDIVAISESFLNASVSDGELCTDGWSVLRRDRDNIRNSTKGGGGVALLARPGVVLCRQKDLESEFGEDLWASFHISNVLNFICVVYIPPNSPEHLYMHWFEKVESVFQSVKGHITIVGDLNLNPLYTPKIILHYYSFFLSFCDLRDVNNILNSHGGKLDVVLLPSSVHGASVTEVGGGGLVPLRDNYHPPLCIEVSINSQSSHSLSTFIEPSNLDEKRDWNFAKGDYGFLYSLHLFIYFYDKSFVAFSTRSSRCKYCSVQSLLHYL